MIFGSCAGLAGNRYAWLVKEGGRDRSASGEAYVRAWDGAGEQASRGEK